MASLSLSPPFFFSFYVLHVDAGEKSPSTQEIETWNSSKNKNKKYRRRLPGYSKNPRVRTEFSQVNLTRLRIDFRKQEPVSYLRLNRFLYRLSQSRSLGFLVWWGRTRHELSLARASRSLARAPRSYDRASRSQSRYALKSSTCEQVYFLYRGGLTGKFSPIRFIKNLFLTAVFTV